jgi:hypothetical protein
VSPLALGAIAETLGSPQGAAGPPTHPPLLHEGGNEVGGTTAAAQGGPGDTSQVQQFRTLDIASALAAAASAQAAAAQPTPGTSFEGGGSRAGTPRLGVLTAEAAPPPVATPDADAAVAVVRCEQSGELGCS